MEVHITLPARHNKEGNLRRTTLSDREYTIVTLSLVNDTLPGLGASYDALTVDEVSGVAKKFFDRDQRSVVITLPGKPEAGAAKGGAQ